MKYILLLIIFIFLGRNNAQDQRAIDSLYQELINVKSDTDRIQLRSEIGFEAWILRIGYWDSIAIECRHFLKDEAKLHKDEIYVYKQQLATALLSVGYINSNEGEIEKALSNYEESLIIQEEIGDKEGLATTLNNLATIYEDQANVPKSLEYYKRSLAIREEIGDKSGIASTLNNLAYTYAELKEFEMSLDYFEKSLAMSREFGEERSVGLALNNIGAIYEKTGRFKEALKYHLESLELRLKINDLRGVAMSYNNLGIVNHGLKNYDDALEFYQKSLAIYEDNNAKKGVGSVLTNMAKTYLEQGNFKEAEKCVNESLAIAKELGFPPDIMESAKIFSITSKQKGNWKKAMEMYELFIEMKDSLGNEDNRKLAIKQNLQYEYEKKTIADSIVTAEEKRVTDAQIMTQKAQLDQEAIKRNVLYGGLGALLLFGLFMYNRVKITQRQKSIIEDQKKEVESQKEIAEFQKELVEERNKQITDSIIYAKRIQKAILPPDTRVQEYLKDYFILYKPKDIVAGDFYWMEKKQNILLFAAADCTGHGVPGAMVSVVCNNGLNRSVREYGIVDPGKVLDKTRDIVIEEFSKSEENVVDGMDISLCAIENNVLKWAGANNPLWIIRNEELIEIAPDKQPIGKYAFPEPFTTHEMEIQKDDIIYIFTDGLQDQFGGEKSKKYKAKRFKNLLLSIVKEPLQHQQKIIDEAFEDWRGDLEQIDDVCIIGVKI